MTLHAICTRLFVNCIMNPEVPSVIMLRASVRAPDHSFVRRKCSLNRVRRPCRNSRAKSAEPAWEMTVAMAAPRTPRPKAKMKSGSKMRLLTAPRMTVSMPTVGNPWALMNMFMPVPVMTKNVPIR